MTANKSILISVNESENSMKAVCYVGSIVGGHDDYEITLLYVAPEPHPYYFREGHSEADYLQEKKNIADSVFFKAVQCLKEFGIAEEGISTRVYVTEKIETISDAILKVQNEGNYGTVVVGKRGVSKAEEFLFGSISNAVTRKCDGFTIWVVA